MRKPRQPSPPHRNATASGWVHDGVQIWSSGLLPLAARGWPTACFTGRLYGFYYAHLTASVILSDGSAKRNDELLGHKRGLDEALTFLFWT